ncbi:MAG: hypothetical protein ACM3S1_04185, partial [Hyphomicrobiales bacterium]
MPTVTAEGMEIIFSDYKREPTGVEGMELLTMDLTYRNPNHSRSEPVRPPEMELRDDLGNVYTVVTEDTFTQPIEPGESVRANPRFEVNVEAQTLDLVVSPGGEDETHVEL